MMFLNVSRLLFVLFLFSQCKESDRLQIDPEIRQEQFESILSNIEAGVYGETHSLLVYQNDELLVEAYFEPFHVDSIHYQYSVTKSITAMLIGIALDEGFISDVDQKLLDFFPEYDDIQNLTERKKAITLHDVLTMRTGLIWDEWTYPYGDQRNDTYNLFGSHDMIKHMLDLPMNSEPGTRFTYNSGATMLLSGIIANSTGMSTAAFAEAYLFSPLGIENWQWDQGLYDDLTNTGWGLHLRPLDMLKIGRLFLDNDETVISNHWLEACSGNYGNNYGYQWWHYGPGTSLSARGWGGQFIFINQEKNLVVVTTAGNFQNSNTAGQALAEKVMDLL